MLTDFGIARMTQYTQSFFQTTTRDGKFGSLRWTAYELVICDLQSESDDNSSVEEDLPPSGSAVGFARPTERRYSNLAMSSTRSEAQPSANACYEPELPETKVEDEDADSRYHTKETDMWAFGMVIYVCKFILILRDLTHCDPRK